MCKLYFYPTHVQNIILLYSIYSRLTMTKSITKRRRMGPTKKGTRNLRRNKKGGKRGKKTVSRRTRRVPRMFRRRQSRRFRKMMRGGHDAAASGDASSIGSPSSFSLVPSTVTDLGRSIQFGVNGAYSAVNGDDGPINPLPYKDQLNNGQLPDDIILQA